MRSSAVIDDGRFHFKENQAQQVFEDHTAAFFNNNTGRQRLLAADVGQSSSSSAVVAVPKAKAKAKAKAVDTEDTSSDDEMSPMEKELAKANGAPPVKGRSAKTKTKDKDKAGKAGPLSAGAGGGGGGRGRGGGEGDLDASTEQFMEEVQRELDVLKGSSRLTEASLESLESLASRLQSTRTKLAKKAAKKSASADVLNSLDVVARMKAKVNAMVDIVKSTLAFQKKKVRKHAALVEDKFHGMKYSGVTLDMLPVCLTASPVSARACILCCDLKFKECQALVDEAELRKFVPGGNAIDISRIRREVIVQVMLDHVRHLLDTKDSSTVARVQSLCADFQGHTGGDVQRFLKSVMTVLNDKVAGVGEVIEASIVFNRVVMLLMTYVSVCRHNVCVVYM